jgi:hypothetical protein
MVQNQSATPARRRRRRRKTTTTATTDTRTERFKGRGRTSTSDGVTHSTRFEHAAKKKRERKGKTQTKTKDKDTSPTPKPASGDKDATPKVHRGRKWTNERNVARADKMTGRDKATNPEALDENRGSRTDSQDRRDAWLRRSAIVDRARRRRYPWFAAGVTLAFGLVAYLVGLAFEAAGASPAPLAAAVAVVPVLIGLIMAARMREEARRWRRELVLAGVAAALFTYWTGQAGVSQWTLVLLLVGTAVGGRRWWAANAVGPWVPPIGPPGTPAPWLPAGTPAPWLPPAPADEAADAVPAEATSAADGAPAAPTAASAPKPRTRVVANPDKDPIALDWEMNNAREGGRAKGSILTNREEDEHTIRYLIECVKGRQSAVELRGSRRLLASGLGMQRNRVLIDEGPADMGEHIGSLTIIKGEPVSDTRFFTEPRVDGGLIKGVARRVDSRGEVDVMIYDHRGMKTTAVVSSPGGGKSAAINYLVTCGLSTGRYNGLYVDPKGNSSTALATRARVAIIGMNNVVRMPALLNAMLEARGKLAGELERDTLFPSEEIPGWIWVFDEYSSMVDDPSLARCLTRVGNKIRSLGIWGLAANHSLAVPPWHTDMGRAAWMERLIAFKINSDSSAGLVPGLLCSPNNLPVGADGLPLGGSAVHSYVDVPLLWNWLPSDADGDFMRSNGEAPPPITASQAFDRFFRQPPPHEVDEMAIREVLGSPVNGRWQIGGKGATHTLPDLDGGASAAGASPSTQAPAPRWGQVQGSGSGTALTKCQARVLGLVRDGTTQTGDIVRALDGEYSESAIKDALPKLVTLGVLVKTGHGSYAPAAVSLN